MRNKILTICIVGMFLLTGLLTVSAVGTKIEKQTIAGSETRGTYSLSFETVPGGCTCEVYGVGTKTSSCEDEDCSWGYCVFNDLEEGWYDWEVRKTGYKSQSGSFYLDCDTKIIAVLECESDLEVEGPPNGYYSVACEPGDGVHSTEPFKVYNVGEPGSELDWDVSPPGFGSFWSFNPSSGDNLKPEDGKVSVDFTFTAPGSQGTYEDYIKVKNRNNPKDFVEIKVICFVYDTCCFPAGIKITMADRSYKNIEDIRFGDRVLSYNIKNGRFTSWRVKLLGDPIHPVYEINDGLLSFTIDHPILVKKPDGTTGWGAIDIKAAKAFTRLKTDILTIEIGDQVYTADEEWIEITNIEYKSDPIQTYNIMSFSGTKTYFANGILVFEENPPFSVWRANNFYIRGYIKALINVLLERIMSIQIFLNRLNL